MGGLAVMFQEKIWIIIPSLEPDMKMISLIKDLKREGFQNIVIVNDGSSDEYVGLYKIAGEDFGCKVLTHGVNLGKGRAIKTALNYLITESNAFGAVTVDSDGQHKIKDILALSEEVIEHPNQLTLGCRSFSKEGIPFRSKFGNVFTAKVLSILCGMRISDTQTGLRGFGRELMKSLLTVKGERFEYEMNMLLYAKENDVFIEEIPIETVYIEENASSHFNPVFDSLKIYSVFLKFIVASFSSFVVDIVLFTVAYHLLKRHYPDSYIIIATVFARILSSLYNYNMNKRRVFRLKEKNIATLAKYYILCVIQTILSGVGVYALYRLFHWNETGIKILVDVILFFLSFQIQREWVFKKRKSI